MDRRRFFKQAGTTALAMAIGSNTQPVKSKELFYNHPNMNNNKRMKHKCKITILKRECYKDLQAKYLADPQSGPCPYFHEGQEIMVDSDNFFRMLNVHSVPKPGIASAVTYMRRCREVPSCRAGRTTKR